MNAPATASSRPSGLITVTNAAPSRLGGVTAVMVWASTTATWVASCDPKNTLAPAVKSLPDIVIGVPPDTGPCGGTMVAIRGGGFDETAVLNSNSNGDTSGAPPVEWRGVVTRTKMRSPSGSD